MSLWAKNMVCIYFAGHTPNSIVSIFHCFNNYSLDIFFGINYLSEFMITENNVKCEG